MSYRNANYCAFYVDEPFSESNLGANATPDFCYYNTLRAWKGADSSFPFIDAHNKSYQVRDGSNWERTLKPRLHQRLNEAKNIILFLSSHTKNSRALQEEIEYGVGQLKLPVIVVYPEYDTTDEIDVNFSQIKQLWTNIPAFCTYKTKVPVAHIPMKKDVLKKALSDSGFTVQSPYEAKDYKID